MKTYFKMGQTAKKSAQGIVNAQSALLTGKTVIPQLTTQLLQRPKGRLFIVAEQMAQVQHAVFLPPGSKLTSWMILGRIGV